MFSCLTVNTCSGRHIKDWRDNQLLVCEGKLQRHIKAGLVIHCLSVDSGFKHLYEPGTVFDFGSEHVVSQHIRAQNGLRCWSMMTGCGDVAEPGVASGAAFPAGQWTPALATVSELGARPSAPSGPRLPATRSAKWSRARSRGPMAPSSTRSFGTTVFLQRLLVG